MHNTTGGREKEEKGVIRDGEEQTKKETACIATHSRRGGVSLSY